MCSTTTKIIHERRIQRKTIMLADPKETDHLAFLPCEFQVSQRMDCVNNELMESKAITAFRVVEWSNKLELQ